jgi:hypothetical protein
MGPNWVFRGVIILALVALTITVLGSSADLFGKILIVLIDVALAVWFVFLLRRERQENERDESWLDEP